jgi:hypothetical protein
MCNCLWYAALAQNYPSNILVPILVWQNSARWHTGIQAGAPPDSLVHAVFHVSQLNSYAPDYTPVYSELPTPLQLDVAELLPEDILYRGLVKRANASYLQVLIKWTILPASMATWEDYTVLRQRFLAAAAWG